MGVEELLKPQSRRERLAQKVANLLGIPAVPCIPLEHLLSPLDLKNGGHRVSSGRVRWSLQQCCLELRLTRNQAWAQAERKLLITGISIMLAGPLVLLTLLLAKLPPAISWLIVAGQLSALWGHIIIQSLIGYDKSRFNRALEEQGELLALTAAGGFGPLPAWCVSDRQVRPSIWDKFLDEPESIRTTLDRLGLQEWFTTEGLNNEQLEVLEKLAEEYDGSIEELVKAALLLGC